MPIEVLILDDDELVEAMVRRRLREASGDYRITWSPDLQGIPLGYRPEVVLLDHLLGHREGWDLFPELSDRWPDAPIVVLTGHGGPGIAERYLECGAAGFQDKDDLRHLERNLRFAVHHHRMLSERAYFREIARVAERHEAVAVLATGVAHEFNNLNTVILGNVESALRMTSTRSSLRDYLENAITALNRGSDLSRRLTGLARHRSGREEILDVEEVLADLVEIFRPLATRRRVALEFEGRADGARIRADAADLQQVVLNLLHNAMDALWQAEEPRAVLVCDRLDGEVVISVRDNGVGIDEEDLGRIFLPFFSRKGARDRRRKSNPENSGTGLGLAVCERIVHNNRWEIDVDSRPGQGTVFRVAIPAVEADVPEPAEGKAGEEPLHVAVVSDQRHFCKMLADHLEGSGHRITVVSRPLRALDDSSYLGCDVVILDDEMRDVGVGDLAERLQLLPVPPLLCYLGEDAKLDPQLLGGIRAQAVPKPVDFDEIDSLLEECLRKSRVSGRHEARSSSEG